MHAAANIQAAVPGALVKFEALDLASLASVRDFAARIAAEYGALDVLINNAGVMALPTRQVTADGFEMQLGVNFLGHFALTALAAAAAAEGRAHRASCRSPPSRIAGAASISDDLQAVRDYKPWKVYQQIEARDADVRHGIAAPQRCRRLGPSLARGASRHCPDRAGGQRPGRQQRLAFLLKLGKANSSPSPRPMARCPRLLAATSPDVTPGGYYGPTGFMEFRGPAGDRETRTQGPRSHRGQAPVGRGRDPDRAEIHTRPVTAARSTASRSPSPRGPHSGAARSRRA